MCALAVAVLCSVNGVSSIRIYRGGATTNVAVVNRVPDHLFLQDVGGGVLCAADRSADAGERETAPRQFHSPPIFRAMQ